ncbi:hypothetical protein EST38_g5312 [Candolleomyces aberdarensis]|uniref:Uncharacterized protein n=1 Tax=Candolleomyces aberdarensis TaxID=2316362 RepID=A0A4Q2DKE5_9AGAR|nr:hypothetical protein EST38_g5312 [Candolleomyces aberdarensis]
MPNRPRNVRNSKKNRNLNSPFESSTDSTPLDSPVLSPPTQLPTPLPELEEPVPHHPHEEVEEGEPAGLGFIVPPHDQDAPQIVQPRLIDFDHDDEPLDHPTHLSMPAPGQPHSRPPPFIANDDHDSVYPITERGDDDDMNTAPGVYRSPPFIEAQLPDEDDEEAPLPILPRISREAGGFGVEHDTDSVDHGFAGFSAVGVGGGMGIGGGHYRSPTIPRFVVFIPRFCGLWFCFVSFVSLSSFCGYAAYGALTPGRCPSIVVSFHFTLFLLPLVHAARYTSI